MTSENKLKNIVIVCACYKAKKFMFTRKKPTERQKKYVTWRITGRKEKKSSIYIYCINYILLDYY